MFDSDDGLGVALLLLFPVLLFISVSPSLFRVYSSSFSGSEKREEKRERERERMRAAVRHKQAKELVPKLDQAALAARGFS